MIKDNHIKALIDILGPKGAITDPAALAPHLEEWRGKFFGKTPIMLAPATAEEAAEAIRYCNTHSLLLVPQGGNTGLVGGGIPGLSDREEILISSKRLRGKIEVEAADFSLTASAGFTVHELQEAAAEHGLMFPLSLASEGSCTVGGIVSTNAGGMHVIRYGNTRAFTLGLEAVLPNGNIFNDLSALRKDNTGYNLSQLLIGAEGTLGFVTAATFKLFPAEVERHTLWLAIANPEAALELLASAKAATGDRVSVFEIMSHTGLGFVFDHIEGTRNPLENMGNWCLLIEAATSAADPNLRDTLDRWLDENLASGLIKDGALAANEQQRQAFWKLRESMSEAQKHEGGSIKHDISVPVSRIPAFIKEGTSLLEKNFPGCRVTPFGHMGDGNLHFNVMQPKGVEKQAFLDQWETMNSLLHDLVINYGGSISAEHGIGTLKAEELARTKSPAALKAMKSIKAALDPNGIMNPGSIFSQSSTDYRD